MQIKQLRCSFSFYFTFFNSRFLPGSMKACVFRILNFQNNGCRFKFIVLSIEKDEEAAAVDFVAEEDVTSHSFPPATMSHLNSVNSDLSIESFSVNRESGNNETLRNCFNSNEEDIQRVSSSSVELARISSGSKELMGNHNTEIPPRGTLNNQINGAEIQSSDEKGGLPKKWKQVLWKTCVYLVTIGMLVSLLMGLNMSFTAITAAIVLVVLDFKDARPCLEKISYSLLVFFCGMFITVEGFNKTGIPGTVWDFMEPYAHIDRISGVAVLSLVVLILSNLASNVPTVLLLGAPVAASAALISAGHENKAWLILAWVSTVAGNLTLLGSAANLIVCEQARRAQFLDSYTVWITIDAHCH